jgi:hypothetical protein
MPYTADKPLLRETSEQLRQRIPGWGVDLDPRDRPSVPKEQFDPEATGAHWTFPERQPERRPRERSIEHAFLTPVFGTSCPPKGLSGVLRRFAYARFSEARAAHWLILLGADRIDTLESAVTSLLAGAPDNPIAETGVRSEVSHHGLTSRREAGRADVTHQLLDPVLIVGPWIAVVGGAAYAMIKLVRAVAGSRSGNS